MPDSGSISVTTICPLCKVGCIRILEVMKIKIGTSLSRKTLFQAFLFIRILFDKIHYTNGNSTTAKTQISALQIHQGSSSRLDRSLILSSSCALRARTCFGIRRKRQIKIQRSRKRSIKKREYLVLIISMILSDFRTYHQWLYCISRLGLLNTPWRVHYFAFCSKEIVLFLSIVLWIYYIIYHLWFNYHAIIIKQNHQYYGINMKPKYNFKICKWNHFCKNKKIKRMTKGLFSWSNGCNHYRVSLLLTLKLKVLGSKYALIEGITVIVVDQTNLAIKLCMYFNRRSSYYIT